MMTFAPRKAMIVGGILVVFGFVIPFLMTIRVIPPSFLLAFLAHGASVGGLLLGMIGAALYVRLEGR